MNIPCWLFPNVYNRTITLSRLPHIILIFQPAAHGTDISTGNQPGIPSLPSAPLPATPDAGSTNSPSPGDFCNTPHFSSYPGLLLAGHDRNHNTAVSGECVGECARPGCRNLLTKAADGTESTYCSSECVVGQCR